METGQSYKTTQSHGTILVETCKALDEHRINSLRSGEGELFLKGIHSLCTPEKIMEVATHFGEIYQMRYKIDYYGRGRGFAYLQYIDITSSALALNRLSNRFLQNGLNVTVRVSKNIRELSLHGINTLAPQEVYQQLQKLFKFEKLTIYGYSPDCYLYNIRFENNAAACLAHLSLRTHIGLFGSQAKVIWLHLNQPFRSININAHCCLKWNRQIINKDVDLYLLCPNKCRCSQMLNLIRLT